MKRIVIKLLKVKEKNLKSRKKEMAYHFQGALNKINH